MHLALRRANLKKVGLDPLQHRHCRYAFEYDASH